MASIKSQSRTRKWWYSRIRSGSWFSFRYYWFAWLCFLLGAGGLLYFVFRQFNYTPEQNCTTLSLHTIESINKALNKCCTCQNEDSIKALVFPADFLVITYQFDQNGGRDLDTKTEIVTPTHVGPLGFFHKKNRLNSSSLLWSGDNTGYGVESFVIDLTKFGPNDLVSVDCSAIWYSIKASGQMSLDIRAYDGGQMTQSGYQFRNIGGVETAFTSFDGNVNARGKKASLLEFIGRISYNKREKRLAFNPAQ
jgi:hypothetical protein